MRSSDIDKINEILFNLVNGRDFAGLHSFFRVTLGFDPIISRALKGIVVIDPKTGHDIVFIPFREYL